MVKIDSERKPEEGWEARRRSHMRWRREEARRSRVVGEEEGWKARMRRLARVRLVWGSGCWRDRAEEDWMKVGIVERSCMKNRE
jgi:hypothetical protein